MALKLLLTSIVFWALVSASAAQDGDYCRPVSKEAETQLMGRQAVITDIDGILSQYTLLDYGPTNGLFLDLGVDYPRQDAALMLNIYHRRGYAIVYVAGRPRQMEVQGKSMCEATLDWLFDHGFPVEPGHTLVLLRDGAPAVVNAKNRGQAMAEWMGDHGANLVKSFADEVTARFNLSLRYGYVDSDVVTDGFIAGGVPAQQIFTIGNKGVSQLGYRGTTPIIGPEANPGYTGHISNFVVPRVPAAR